MYPVVLESFRFEYRKKIMFCIFWQITSKKLPMKEPAWQILLMKKEKVLKRICTETKTSWEQVKIDVVHVSTAKTSVNHRMVLPKIVETFFVSVPKNWWTVSFCISGSIPCFWRCLVLPIGQVEKFWWTIEWGITKRCGIFFVSKENFVSSVLVFLKVCGFEKLCLTGVSRFSSFFFVSQYQKISGKSFCISKNFWFRKNLWIRRGPSNFFVSQNRIFFRRRDLLVFANLCLCFDFHCML